MRLTSACTRACGPSEAIPDPDPDLGSRGAGTCTGTPTPPFFSQDSPQRAAEKGPPGEGAAWNHREEGFNRMRPFRSCRPGGSDPGTAWGSPGSAENPCRPPARPPAQCPPTTLSTRPATASFSKLLSAQEWLGEGSERERGTSASRNCRGEGRGVTCFRDTVEGFPESRGKKERREGEQKAYPEGRGGGGVVQGALRQVSGGWSQDRVRGAFHR